MLIALVRAYINIKVYLNAEVTKTAGAPGMYDVTITSGGTEAQEKIGTVVMAVGWQPYDPANLADKYGYGNLANVITSDLLRDIAEAGRVHPPGLRRRKGDNRLQGHADSGSL